MIYHVMHSLTSALPILDLGRKQYRLDCHRMFFIPDISTAYVSLCMLCLTVVTYYLRSYLLPLLCKVRDLTYIINTNNRKMLKKTSGATTIMLGLLEHTNILIALLRQLSERVTCFKCFPFLFPFLICSCVLFCIKRHCS